MKIRAALIVAALGTASSAFAQQADTQGSITYTLSSRVWRPAAVGNWVSAPTQRPVGSTVDGAFGDAVLFSISMSYTGTAATDGSGTALTWSPMAFSPSSGSGTLAGFWSGDIDLVGGANSLGTWSDTSATYNAAVKRSLAIFTTGNNAGGNGYVNGSYLGTTPGPGDARTPANKVTDIQPAQLTDDAATANTSAGGTIWKGLWIPTDYSSRAVSFNIILGHLGFLSKVAAVDDQYFGSPAITAPIPLSVGTNFTGTSTFNIVPSPSSFALLGLGGLIAARRRRA